MKSDVIYHFIDGYVIEESDVPFNGGGTRLADKTFQDVLNRQQEMIANEEAQKRKALERYRTNKSFHLPKRTVTSGCLKCGRRMSKQTLDDEEERLCSRCVEQSTNETMELTEEDNVFNSPPISPVAHHKDDPNFWTMNDVRNYISSIPAGEKYADEFKRQEIDGCALLLIRVDHLISSMHMKLGPAMKLCSSIDILRNKWT